MMKIKNTVSILIICLALCCSNKADTKKSDAYTQVNFTGAMMEVMKKGELQGKIKIDSITDKKGLYGLGPEAYLTGEILISDGNSYVSKVLTDSTMHVIKTDNVEAPFFVYQNVTDWKAFDLPDSVSSIGAIENQITKLTSHIKKPFAFKLEGTIGSADIHIQNLPYGTEVNSPEEAHQGQVNYSLLNEEVIIIGFYSQNHQGVFTHHDSFLHMHLLTRDETKMGHVDAIKPKNLKLYLPKILFDN